MELIFHSTNDILNSVGAHCLSVIHDGAPPPIFQAPAVRHTYGAYDMCTKMLGYTCVCCTEAPKCEWGAKTVGYKITKVSIYTCSCVLEAP